MNPTSVNDNDTVVSTTMMDSSSCTITTTPTEVVEVKTKDHQQTPQEDEALVEETDVMELCTALLDEDDAAAAAASSSSKSSSNNDHHERSSTMENMQEFILDSMKAEDTNKTKEIVTHSSSSTTTAPPLYKQTETIWEHQQPQQPNTASPTSLAPTPYSVVTVDEQRDGKVREGAPLIWLPPVVAHPQQNRLTAVQGSGVGAANGTSSSSTNRRFVPTPSIPHPGYTDRAGVTKEEVLYLAETQPLPGPKNNRIPFPYILHDMLLEVSRSSDKKKIVSWQKHGRAFKVHQHKIFVSDILPEYFKQSKYTSFQRQLNLYGFRRITGQGPDHGAYYHEYFLRGKKYLCDQVVRVKLEGLLHKPSQHPDKEPKFHNYPPVLEEKEEQDQDRVVVTDAPTAAAAAAVTASPSSLLTNETLLSSNSDKIKKRSQQEQIPKDHQEPDVHPGASSTVATNKKMKKTVVTKKIHEVSSNATASVSTEAAAIVSPTVKSPPKKSQMSSSLAGVTTKNVSSSWSIMTNGPPSSPGLSTMPFYSSTGTAFKPVDSSASKTAALVAPVPNPLAKQVSFLALPSLSGSINNGNGNDVAAPPVAATPYCEQQQQQQEGTMEEATNNNIPRCTPVTQTGDYEQQPPDNAYYNDSNQEGVHDAHYNQNKPWLVTPVRPTPSRIVTTANDSSLVNKTTTQELMLPATTEAPGNTITEHVSTPYHSFRSLDDSSNQTRMTSDESNQRHHLVSPNASPIDDSNDDEEDEVLMFEGKPFHYLEPFHSMESFLKYHKLNHTYLEEESSSSKEGTTTKVAS